MTESQVQSLCTPTEWKTVVNSFPPKLSELGPAAAKKNAKRISRFLGKAETDDNLQKAEALREALERLQALLPQKAEGDKQIARRQKEKEAHKKRQAAKNQRAQVRDRMRQKVEEIDEPEVSPTKKKKKTIRELFQGERK